MEKLIDAILKLIPFADWLQRAGLGKETSAGLSVVIVAALVWGLASWLKNEIQRWNLQKSAKRLDPQFDYAAMRKATRYYIPTQFQNANPSRQDEPGFTHQFVSRNLLIPFFLKKAFNEKVDSERFYIVLADSGMGKTTFMINLYLRYHSIFNRGRKHRMRLYRFSHPDTMDQVKAMKYEEAKDTILLLDALDEDPFIVSKDPNVTDAQAFQNRLADIIEATRNFAEVVLTCRTQYFPGQEDDPYELEVKRPDEKGFYKLNKLYLSPFTLDEVKTYLRKKYGFLPFINWKKKKQALQVVGQAKHLVMRPMMLSYIDLLVDHGRNFQSDYHIYETLIEEWLKREAEKRKHRNADQKLFIENLRKVSEQTALALWDVRQSENRAFLTRAEALEIANRNGIPLRPEEVTGQSLLTCDGAGNWKFAHKSVWEFFLAREVFRDRNFARRFHFKGMDMARHFVGQKLPGSFVFVAGGTFERGTPKQSIEVSNFWIGKYPVTQAEYEKVTAKPNPSEFIHKKNNPVETVSWFDAIVYCNQINEQFGYSKIFDDEGNLLEPNGSRATKITEVRGFRLPTEAEWEFAARGGNQSQCYEYSGSNKLDEVGWYEKNAEGKTRTVGQLKPNELGICDMSGNVWEWCLDWYGDYPPIPESDPCGPHKGASRVVRGGSWSDNSEYCLVALRGNRHPDRRYTTFGFRVVFVP